MFEPHHLAGMGQTLDRITFPDGVIALNIIERFSAQDEKNLR